MFPATTMNGALCRYVTTPQKHFQPMKANFGLLPPLDPPVRKKRERYTAYSHRALADLKTLMADARIEVIPVSLNDR